MIYTQKTIEAMKLAYTAHHGQVDKSGVPYIFHPIHVAEQMNTEKRTILALLHDVVEDTEVTMSQIREKFGQDIVDVLVLLTHEKNVPYLDYINKIKNNPDATAVKIADMKHNLERIYLLPEDIQMRLKSKYNEAWKILNNNENKLVDEIFQKKLQDFKANLKADSFDIF